MVRELSGTHFDDKCPLCYLVLVKTKEREFRILIFKIQKKYGTEGWNKNISHLQSGGREIRRYMKQQVVLKLFFHMGVLTGIEIKVAF